MLVCEIHDGSSYTMNPFAVCRDLHPDPPPTARISKKVGIAVLGVVVFVGVLVVYGLYARQEQQQVAQAKNEEKHPESARHIGDQWLRSWLRPPLQIQLRYFPGAPRAIPYK